MPKHKTVVVRHGDHRHERTAETVEQALRNIAKEVDEGDLSVPFVLEFDGPSGAKYNIAVDTGPQLAEVTTLGFMY